MSNEKRQPILVPRQSPQYQRMRYYSAIKSGLRHMGEKTTYLDVPTHVIKPEMFVVFQKSGDSSGGNKHSSISTIFSVWNTMVGSSLLTIPWAFSNTGIVLGVFISFITFVISFYTCSLYIKMAGNDSDFADTVYKYFGKYGWLITMIFSNFFLMFAVVVIYYELMSQALFPIILALIQWITNHEISLDTGLALNRFSLFYTCIALTIILFPIVSKKDISLFIKLNTFGVLFVCIILLFILAYGFYSFTNTTFVISNEPNNFDSDIRNISLFKSSFNSLAGMMTLGYYLHGIGLSITKETEHPENNIRDVFIGYFMVFLSYTLVGSLGYLGFSGSLFKLDICNTQNLLYMFKATDILAFIVRVTCFLQMFSVYPMLFCITRNFFSSILNKGKEMNGKSALIFNAALILIATVIGATFPKVGSILGYVGGFVGLGLIYIIPIAVYLKRYKMNLEHPQIVEALDENRIKTIPRKSYEVTSPKIGVVSPTSRKRASELRATNLNNSTNTSTEEERLARESLLSQNIMKKEHIKYGKYYMQCFIHSIIILVGVAILVLQFIPL